MRRCCLQPYIDHRQAQCFTDANARACEQANDGAHSRGSEWSLLPDLGFHDPLNLLIGEDVWCSTLETLTELDLWNSGASLNVRTCSRKALTASSRCSSR